MIGKRNIVEIIINIVDVEGGPATIAALQAFHPFSAAFDRQIIAVTRAATPGTVHRHDGNCGIIEIGIVGIGILKRPATGPHMRPSCRPIADNVEDLAWQEPIQPAKC